MTLDKKYHYLGEKFAAEDPWLLNGETKTEFPFKTVRDIRELERVLHWAQIATLNPGKNHMQYASADELGLAESLEVKFSPNVVRLDVSFRNFVEEYRDRGSLWRTDQRSRSALSVFL